MTIGTRTAGDFCWINMLTPDPAQARDFFGGLFGWTYVEMPGMGHRIQVGGRDVGAMFLNVDANAKKEWPPVIGVTVKVDDAEAVGAKVIALGGKAQPPMVIGEAGRMAVCHDPNGAQFDLWEPKKMKGTDADSHAHGAPTWFETLTTDADRARDFYTALFGWTAQHVSQSGYEYTTFVHGTTPVAGMMAITPQMPGIRPHWGVYFAVRDADAAVRAANERGATVCVPARDIPDVGRFAGIISPQGVMFYVITYLPRASS